MVGILVAEDDGALLRLVGAALKADGYSVTQCADGEQAADAFERGNFDLVITDVMMPKLDGFALAELIRDKNSEVPILFMSARDDKPSKQLGFKLGIDDYITKPFDIDIFLLKIKAVLRRSAIKKTNSIEVGNLTLNADGLCGIAILACALPLHSKLQKRGKEKYGKEILELSEELLKDE